ncbi:DUF1444 family protein [Candidatus Clostridium radicumherbarum]|uniref:DUF1444 family protein n=1 Tax=Candidatus Clostridium radicumherbarum TaxID=3381662 RepID=A0ABW8TXF9_9CLOT
MKHGLNKERLMIKLLNDIIRIYPDSRISNDLIKISDGNVDLSLPISQIYSEYSIGNRDYNEIFSEYLKVIREIIEQHNFKIDYDTVYPLLRHKTFGINEECEFFREQLFLDIHLMLASDMGELFRYVLMNDKGVNYNQAYDAAMININKLTDVLVKMDNRIDVYTTKYSSDYASSLILNKNMQRQIQKKIGPSYIFAIPASSVLFVAPQSDYNIDVVKALVKENQDPNIISDKVMIHSADGSYHFVDS